MHFLISDYIRLLDYLRARGREVRTVAGFFASPGAPSLILRHDVDRFPSRAVQLAGREAAAGVHATYYFRCDRQGGFPEAAVRRIAGWGHEIGYHYEDLSRCHGDLAAARESFGRNLAALRGLAACRTVSMHGSPLSRHDNRTLLAGVRLADHGLLGDASTGLHDFAPLYFTDAGGSWNNPRTNFRDRLGLMPENLNPCVPAELDLALAAHSGRPLCLNLHPERWSASAAQTFLPATCDTAAGVLKVALRILRR